MSVDENTCVLDCSYISSLWADVCHYHGVASKAYLENSMMLNEHSINEYEYHGTISLECYECNTAIRFEENSTCAEYGYGWFLANSCQ